MSLDVFAPRVSRLDRWYARLANRRPLFREGWGSPAVEWPPPMPGPAEVRWTRRRRFPFAEVRSGWFPSPVSACGTAHVELWLPRKPRGIVLHLPATGDHGFGRRRLMALPLLARGIGTLILEGPFYGLRRPEGQEGTRLRTVADLFALGAGTVAEGLALLQTLEGPVAVAGISRGGQMAALVAALHPGRVAVVACAAPHSAEVVFTRGIMQIGCDWEALGGRAEALPRLRAMLDETDLRRFPAPGGPAIVLGAARDAYIPPASVDLLHRWLPGSTLRWLDTGHVGAVLFHPGAFLRALAEVL